MKKEKLIDNILESIENNTETFDNLSLQIGSVIVVVYHNTGSWDIWRWFWSGATNSRLGNEQKNINTNAVKDYLMENIRTDYDLDKLKECNDKMLTNPKEMLYFNKF